MKRIVIMSLAFGLISFTGVQAQAIENVKKETTIKTVTVKDTNVETIVDKEVDETRSVVKVEGTAKTNQDSKEVVVKDNTTKTTTVEERGVNTSNKKDLKKLQKEQNKAIKNQQGTPPALSDDKVQTKPKATSLKRDDSGK